MFVLSSCKARTNFTFGWNPGCPPECFPARGGGWLWRTGQPASVEAPDRYLLAIRHTDIYGGNRYCFGGSDEQETRSFFSLSIDAPELFFFAFFDDPPPKIPRMAFSANFWESNIFVHLAPRHCQVGRCPPPGLERGVRPTPPLPHLPLHRTLGWTDSIVNYPLRNPPRCGRVSVGHQCPEACLCQPTVFC